MAVLRRLLFLPLFFGTLACSLTLARQQATPVAENGTQADSTTPPTVQIVSPFDGQQVVIGEDVEIQVLATDSIGITRTQLSVADRVSSTKSFPESATNAEALLRWRPDHKGTFTLSVIAFREYVPSNQANLTLQVLGRGETVTNPVSGQSDARVTSGECVARVLISNLRVRTGPGTRYTQKGSFTLNEQLSVLGKNTDNGGSEWLKVRRSDGSENWAINNPDWLETLGTGCATLTTIN